MHNDSEKCKAFPLHYKNNINRAFENSQCRWQHAHVSIFGNLQYQRTICEDTGSGCLTPVILLPEC